MQNNFFGAGLKIYQGYDRDAEILNHGQAS